MEVHLQNVLVVLATLVAQIYYEPPKHFADDSSASKYIYIRYRIWDQLHLLEHLLLKSKRGHIYLRRFTFEEFYSFSLLIAPSTNSSSISCRP